MQETQEIQIWAMCQEDPLEKEMATHFNIPAWKIPWTEEPGGIQSMGLQRVRYAWETNTLYLYVMYFHIAFQTIYMWFSWAGYLYIGQLLHDLHDNCTMIVIIIFFHSADEYGGRFLNNMPTVS